MAKSKIIRDLANGDADVAKALRRLKVLMHSAGQTQILTWVNNELTGYSNPDDLPEYRITKGSLIGTFLLGSPARYWKYENCPIPISTENDSIRDEILTVRATNGISSIQSLVNSKKTTGVAFPPEYYPLLQHGTNISSIITASIRVDETFFQNILASVESILIDLLCALEKEFGVLDALDIDFSEKPAQQEKIIAQLIQYIYVDKSICIGDNNRIKDSEITSD